MAKAMITTVVEIPEGYELLTTMARAPLEGELYLNSNGKVRTFIDNGIEPTPTAILKKIWIPEEGKWYLFANSKSQVGTTHGRLHKFKRMKKYINTTSYLVEDGCAYDYCWSLKGLLNLENIGE